MFKNGDVTAPFRIRLFGIDTDGKPGKELTKDNDHNACEKKQISGLMWMYRLMISKIPDSGFYAAFSLLPYEYYQITYSRRSNS